MSQTGRLVRRTGEATEKRGPELGAEMPRFMGFVRMEENIGTPPASLFEATAVARVVAAAGARYPEVGMASLDSER